MLDTTGKLMRLRGNSRAIVICVLFVLFFWSGDRVGAMLIGLVIDHSSVPVARLYAGTATGNIIVLGDSRAYRNIDFAALEGRLGEDVLNLAQPGASTLLSANLLGDYVARYGSPRLVVLELSGLVANQDAVLTMRMFALRSARLANLLHAWHPRYYWGGVVSHLFAYNNLEALNVAHKALVGMPDLLLEGAITPQSQAGFRRTAGNAYFRNRTENLKALDDLVALAHRHGIVLRFVISPVLPAFAETAGFNEWRNDVFNRIKADTVVDFGTEEIADPGLFYDDLHLNAAGANRFTDKLLASGIFSVE